jgi:hypothetical protein
MVVSEIVNHYCNAYIEKNIFGKVSQVEIKTVWYAYKTYMYIWVLIWISDFTLKDSCIDKLLFEKIPNKFCKNILGVHKKNLKFCS